MTIGYVVKQGKSVTLPDPDNLNNTEQVKVYTAGEVVPLSLLIPGHYQWLVQQGIIDPAEDTGSRDVSADVTTNATDTLDTVQIRRVGNIVYMTLKIANSATSTTHELFATLPDGFKPVADHSTYLLPPNASSASQTTVVSVDSSNGQTQYRNNNSATMCGTVVYVTNDAWPSSLPGSAA